MADLLNLLRRVVEAVTSARDLKLSLARLVNMVRSGLDVDACTVSNVDQPRAIGSLRYTPIEKC